MSIAEQLPRAAQRLEEASEAALFSSAQRSAQYLGEAAAVRALCRSLMISETPSAHTVRALSRSVWLLADCAPRDSREQAAADAATLALAGIAEELEAAEDEERWGPEQPLTAEERWALGLEG